MAAAATKTLGVNDFLKLITVQLTSQDPLKPMEDTQFISQMASFTSLQQMQTLSQDFKTITTDQRETTAQNYLGKTVTIATGVGNITGPVTAVSFDSGLAYLSVNGGMFNSADVIGISQPSAAPTNSPQTNSSTTPALPSATTN